MKRLACFSTILCLLVLLAFVTVAGAQQSEAPPEEVVVSIRDNYFDPQDITVAPGTTVWWVNEGENPHNVTADNGLFDSGTLYPGDSFWVTFDGQGTITYHCSPNMPGSVTVEQQPTGTRSKRQQAPVCQETRIRYVRYSGTDEMRLLTNPVERRILLRSSNPRRQELRG